MPASVSQIAQLPPTEGSVAPTLSPQIGELVATLPPSMRELLETLPPRVPRKQAAELVTQNFFYVEHRSMERWPISWRRLGGKSHCETLELFATAQRMVDSAPICRSRNPNLATA